MCGRFFLQRDPAGLARYFETMNPTPNHPASWHVAPTQTSLAVRRHPESGGRHLDVLRWGLVPRWAKDTEDAAKLITTASEGTQALVHHRMPVILARETWDAWLGAEAAEADDLLALLVPCPSDDLAIWPVDTRGAGGGERCGVVEARSAGRAGAGTG